VAVSQVASQSASEVKTFQEPAPVVNLIAAKVTVSSVSNHKSQRVWSPVLLPDKLAKETVSSVSNHKLSRVA
jgi:hypothetical protein